MEISLPYGKSSISVRFPDECEVSVIRKAPMPLVRSPIDAVCSALEQPVGCSTLSSVAQSSRSACILICDITRPVPNNLLLGPIVDCLVDSGIDTANILILVATGLHRPNLGEELEQLVGDPKILDAIRIENHHARRDSEHVDLGFTSDGTPVRIDARFLDADLQIVTGLVEPHFMAGYSGGRKVLAPGIAHSDTIRTLHSARILDDPNCRSCQIENNPLHREQLEIVEMVRQHSRSEIYAVNTVIDEDRRVAFVNFGDIIASHQAAMEFADRYCTVTVDRKFDTVVTSAAGFPLDQTYYQAIKGMVTPLEILEKNGSLVFAAQCKEGLGSDEFRSSQRSLLVEGPEAFLRRMNAKSAADVDEWETHMQVKAQSDFRISLFTDELSEEDRQLTGLELPESMEVGIETALARSYSKSVAVVPEGPYVVPKFA